MNKLDLNKSLQKLNCMSLNRRDKSYSGLHRDRNYYQKPYHLNQPSSHHSLNKSNVTTHSDHLWHTIQQLQLFPIELSELLRAENHNINTFKMRIERQKNRVALDIDSYKKEIVHHFDDFKLSLMTQLDNIYKMYMERYTKFKSQLLEVKRLRQDIQIQMAGKSIHTDISHKKLSTSNIRTIKAFENGLTDMKKYHIINYITELQKQKISPLSGEAKKLIVLTQYQNGFYLPKELDQLLCSMKDQFKHRLRHLYQCKTYIRDPEDLIRKIGQNEPLLDDQCHIKDDLINKEGFYAKKNREIDIDQQILRQKQQKQKQLMYQIRQKQRLLRQKQLQQRQRQIRQLQRKQKQLFEREKILEHRQRQRSISFEKQRLRERELMRQKEIRQRQFRQRELIQRELMRQKQIRERQLRLKKKDRMHDEFRHHGQLISPTQQVAIYGNVQDIEMREINSLKVNSNDIILCALILKNEYIAIGSKDGSITIYHLIDGSKKKVLTGHRSSICSLAYIRAQGGEYLASGSDHGCCVILVWDIRDWSLKQKLQGHKAAITAIVDLRDTHHIISGSYDKRINIYDLFDGRLQYNLPANKSSVTGIVLNSNSTKMVSCNLDNSLNVWSIVRSKPDNMVQTLYLQRIIQNGTMICSMVGSLMHQEIIYIGTKDGKIKIIDINKGESKKNEVACNNAIIQMVVIQRQNHPYSPIVVVWPCKEQSMKIVNVENSYIKSVPVKGYIQFGCGIGPKALITNKGQLAMLSQSQFWKDVTFYKIQQNLKYG